jgi:mono/diheme cytochrome c family protein
MMRTPWVAMHLALPLTVIIAVACGKAGPAGRVSGDSTATVRGPAKEATVVATGETVAAETQAPPDTLFLLSYAQRRGMRVFRHYCVVCHGEEGKGDGFNAYNLDPKPRDLADAKYQDAISDEALTEVVTQGGRGMNKSVLMPAYGKTLSRDQITDLVAYLRTLAGPRSGEDGS